MSKLEELINKLCPNGVEFKTLGDIATYRRGSFPQPYTNTSFYGGEDAMPFVQVADIKDDGFKLKDKTKQTISKIAQPKSIFVPKGTVICSIQGTIGRVAITQYDSYVDRTIAIFESLNNKIDKKFFAYCIEVKFEVEKQFARGSTLKTITKEEFTKFSIPVPPLEVQCEIVRILDNFTLLSAELSAELKARQKQFSYYREKLYKSNENIKRLDEVVDIRLGLTHTPKYVENGIKFISAQNTSNDYLNLDHVKYISQKEYDSITDNAKPKRGDILFTRVGSNLGHPVIVETDEKLCMFVSLGYLRIKNTNSVLNTYIKHWINTENFWSQVRKNVHGSAKVNLNTGWLSKFEISIPSIEEQQNIVNILDKFEKLCNDISEGLPAEIEARKKQYEYYRDKLLTFKELK